MCNSVLANKDLTGTVLYGHKMCKPKYRKLDLRPRSKALEIMFCNGRCLLVITTKTGNISWKCQLHRDTLWRLNCSDSILFIVLFIIARFLEQDIIANCSHQSSKKTFLYLHDTIKPYVYCLAVIPDPMISNARWKALQMFFFENYFTVSAA